MNFPRQYMKYFFAALLVVHCFLLYLTLHGSLDVLFNDARHRLGLGTDFAVYYNAGAGFLKGEGIYGHGPAFGFRYHPAFAATLCAWLSTLAYQKAFYCWILIEEVCFFLLVLLVCKTAKKPLHQVLALICITLFSPYYLEVFMGNATFICIVIMLWAFYFYQRNKLHAHNGLLLLSLMVKPVGLVLLPAYFFINNRQTPLLVGAVFFLSAVPFFMFGHNHELATFLEVNFNAISMKGWVIHAGNQGLHGFLVDLFVRLAGIPTGELTSYTQLPIIGQYLLKALPLFFIAMAIGVSWKNTSNQYIVFFIWSMIYLLAYKDVWEHSYSCVLLSLYFLYLSGRVSFLSLFIMGFCTALPTAFVFYDLPLPAGPFDPEPYWPMGVALFHHASKSLPLLVFYFYALFQFFKLEPSRK